MISDQRSLDWCDRCLELIKDWTLAARQRATLSGVTPCDPALAANMANGLRALTPRRTVLRLATLLSELGYDLILQVTTLSGLKNSSIGCNRPTPGRMLHCC